MAKRRSGNIKDSSNLFDATDDEYCVAAILLELRHPTAESDPRPRFHLSWGAKKKRRFTDESLSQRRLPLASLPLPPPPPPPSIVTPSLQGCGLSGPKGHALKAEASSSPATPLSFSPNESDECPKRLKRKVFEKKTRKGWLDTIGEFIQSNIFCGKEMDKLKSYYEELKAKNLRLKARKQELSHSNKIGKFCLEASNSNSTGLHFEMKLGQTTVKSTSPVDNQDHHFSHFPGIVVHQSSVIFNQTATRPEPTDYYFPQRCGPMLSLYTSGGVFGKRGVDDLRPLGIPDLNLSPVDSLWTDSNLPSSSIDNKSFSRAVAAQARHKRMQICRDKNSGASNKLRISFR